MILMMLHTGFCARSVQQSDKSALLDQEQDQRSNLFQMILTQDNILAKIIWNEFWKYFERLLKYK